MYSPSVCDLSLTHGVLAEADLRIADAPCQVRCTGFTGAAVSLLGTRIDKHGVVGIPPLRLYLLYCVYI